MSKKYTTFVLGAGLSANYGFPTGAELIKKIENELPYSQDRIDTSSLRASLIGKVATEYMSKNLPDFRFGTSDYLYYEFKIYLIAFSIRSKLLEGDVSSIDSYINEFSVSKDENHEIPLSGNCSVTVKEYNSIATFILKGLIVLIISGCEVASIGDLAKKEELSKNKNKGTYNFLFNSFFKGKSENDLDNIKIINFNYDRSFDYAINYFFKREAVKPYDFAELERSFGASMTSINKDWNSKIIHPYGSLGDLESFRYGQPIVALSQNIDQIKVISSERSNFKAACEAIRSSQSIIFLGFGFDPTNIKNLGLDLRKNEIGMLNPRIWFSTCFMNDFKISSAIRSLYTHSQASNAKEVTDEAYKNRTENLVNYIKSSRTLSSIL